MTTLLPALLLPARILPTLLLVWATAASAADEPLRFEVRGYRVKGNEILDQRTVETAVYPFLGPARTESDVEDARAALEAEYRERGYETVAVSIPQQTIDDGIVRLEVYSGAVDRVRVTGSRYFRLSRIKEEVPSLAPGETPHFPTVTEELGTLNRASADRAVRPILRPGRAPGTVQVELQVEDRFPLHGRVEVNDQRTRGTTRTRVNGSVSYGNLWQREHMLALSFQTAPEDTSEVTAFSASYRLRLLDGGTLLTLYGVRTDSDVAALDTLGVIGNGTIGGLRVFHPLPPVGDWYQSLSGGIDYKDFSESVELLGGDQFNTPIDYWSASLRYDLTRVAERATTRLTLAVSGAAEGVGNDVTEFEAKRFQATPNFVYFRVDLEHLRQALFGTELQLRFGGQVSASPLISNEQLALGGIATVRGYFESQELADDGWYTRIDWYSPLLFGEFADWFGGARALVFADAAGGRLQEALPDRDPDFLIASAGLGLRGELLGLDAEVDWAWPFADSSDDSVEAGEHRLHFRLGYEF